MADDEWERDAECFRRICDLGPTYAVRKVFSAITQIDISITARAAGDLGSAETALVRARRSLIELLGIDKEAT